MTEMKSVFILGAGVSAEAGVPTLEDFLSKMFKDVKEYYQHKSNPSVSESIETVATLNELQTYAEMNLGYCNVEGLLSFLDFMVTIKGNQGDYERKMSLYLRDWIRKTIVAILEKMPPVGKREQYEKFIEVIKREKFPVITFNWDLLLDNRFGGIIDYGSDKFECRGVDLIHSSTPLLKLHGSMNWGVGETGKAYCVREKIDDAIKEPLIVMPTYMKLFENAIFGDIWQRALKEISEADNLFIVGFSFAATDQHFRQFLKHAIKQHAKVKEKPLEIYVITRPKRLIEDKLTFEKRYTDFLEHEMQIRSKFYYMTFSKFVEGMWQIPNVSKRSETFQHFVTWLEDNST